MHQREPIKIIGHRHRTARDHVNVDLRPVQAQYLTQNPHQPVLHVGQLGIGLRAIPIQDDQSMNNGARAAEIVRPAEHGVGETVQRIARPRAQQCVGNFAIKVINNRYGLS